MEVTPRQRIPEMLIRVLRSALLYAPLRYACVFLISLPSGHDRELRGRRSTDDAQVVCLIEYPRA